MIRTAKLAALAAVLMLPALMGAGCSTNAVAQSAATSFFDAIAESAAAAIVNILAPAPE